VTVTQRVARIALAGAVTVACTAQPESRDSAVVQPAADSVIDPHDFWRHVGVVFHPDSVSVGDTIGSLIVDRVNVQPAYDSTPVGTVGFRGEIQLSGSMMRNPDSDYRGVCFEADSLSASRMPRWKEDARRPWFCFDNLDRALRDLARPGQEGNASVVIDRFTIHFHMSDVFNEARLRRVIRRPPPTVDSSKR
jgi:hypothetical protein